MGGNLDPIEAKARNLVADALADCEPGDTVTVAVSGGADSLALALVFSFLAKESGWNANAVVIDHDLQTNSAEVAQIAVEQLIGLGLEAHSKKVVVADEGGLEAAARKARYDYFDSLESKAILLAHTLDDQAETVLLGLGRGSGPRSIAGMRSVNGKYRRPFLTIRRADTEHLCALHKLQPWQDPHNQDPKFRRVRIRNEVLPLLDDVLGGGAAESLARTAEQIQIDLDYLDEMVNQIGVSGDCQLLAGYHPALRSRILRKLAISAGALELTAVHLRELDRLVTDWRGQGPIQLPGHISVTRTDSTLRFVSSDVAG